MPVVCSCFFTKEDYMNLGIDLGGSHIGVGLIEGYELKCTVDKFFSKEDRLDIENAILRII